MGNCGCVPGRHLCKEAVRLWAQAGKLYDAWADTRNDEDWQRYFEAKERYDAHINGAEREAI